MEEELDDGVETSEDDAALDATDDAPSSSGGEDADAGDEGSCAAGWRYARACPRAASTRHSTLQVEAALLQCSGMHLRHGEGHKVRVRYFLCHVLCRLYCCSAGRLQRRHTANVASRGKIVVEDEGFPDSTAVISQTEPDERGCHAGVNGTNARHARVARSPPLGASPLKRARTQLHYMPRKRSRLGEPAAALGLSWDTAVGAGGALLSCRPQCLTHCHPTYHTW